MSEERAIYNICSQASTIDEANDVLKHRFARWGCDREQCVLKAFLESLDWRRREVTMHWYGLGYTQERIAEELGVSVRTVAADLSYVREKALEKFA